MSNLLEKASILLTPTAYDDGKILSVKPEDGTGDFTFTRNSSATRVTSQGLIEITDDTNLPRIDYSPYSGAGSCGHWLFEPQSTNLITYSEDLSQSSWVKQSAGVASTPVVTSNYSISPAGTLNADRIIFNINGGSTSSDFSQLTDPVTASIGSVSSSVYIKSNTASNYTMSFVNALGNTTSIEVTTEWKRFILTATTTTTAAQFKLRLRGSESTSDFADVSVWGAQIEEQSFATSYIPTSGSTVTRLKDAAFGAGNSSLINSTEGVLYAEVSALGDYNDNTARTISITNNSSQEIVRIYYYNNLIVGNIKTGGANVFQGVYSLPNQTDFIKSALKYKQNDFSFFVNGTKIASGTGNTASGLDLLNFNLQGVNTFFGKTKCVAVFKEALTDAELTCLTTI